jgi:alkylated DNA repair dioxygenase AlkB
LSHQGHEQPPLIVSANLPGGFDYAPEFLSIAEERSLLDAIRGIEFSKVEMRGVVARRRTAQYGWTYGYEKRSARPGAPIPDFLLPIRERAARWARLAPEAFAEVLITDYPEGAPIGWHRDAPMFGDIAGVSLGAACRMKLRPYVSPKDAGRLEKPRRTTHQIELAPRSAYLIRAAARRDFEHSIPPVEARRYSITFRTIRSSR